MAASDGGRGQPRGRIHRFGYNVRHMATLRITIPDDLKEFVDAQVASEFYPSAAELLRDLLLWHKRRIEDLAQQERFLNSFVKTGARPSRKQIDAAWAKVRAGRLRELREEVRQGIDQLERGESVRYRSVEECLADIKSESKKLLRQRRRKTA